MLILAVAVYSVACSGQTKKDVLDSVMVVTFVQGDARVVHTASGAEEPATIGMVVKEADQIKTTSGTVDLQSKTGSAVRVREFTSITIAKLAGKNGSTTRVDMNHGSILASVKKASADEDFSVVTPTAVAGVRGTTFSVDVQDGQRPHVKVAEGKVAMAPRISALEGFSQEQISTSEQLQKLATIQSAGEVVLEDNKEGSIDPKIENRVILVNKALLEAMKSEKSLAQIDKLPAVVDTVKMANEIKENTGSAMDVKTAEFSAQEQIDQQTLVAVTPDVLAKVAGQSSADGKPDVAAVEQLKEIRSQQEEIVLKKIEEYASKKDLNSDEEIKKQYNKLELIRMKSGEQIHGAVIAQTGELMVIHSADGVKRVKKDDVDSQEFLY
jgi:hypothetical protein